MPFYKTIVIDSRYQSFQMGGEGLSAIQDFGAKELFVVGDNQ